MPQVNVIELHASRGEHDPDHVWIDAGMGNDVITVRIDRWNDGQIKVYVRANEDIGKDVIVRKKRSF